MDNMLPLLHRFALGHTIFMIFVQGEKINSAIAFPFITQFLKKYTHYPLAVSRLNGLMISVLSVTPKRNLKTLKSIVW